MQQPQGIAASSPTQTHVIVGMQKSGNITSRETSRYAGSQVLLDHVGQFLEGVAVYENLVRAKQLLAQEVEDLCQCDKSILYCVSPCRKWGLASPAAKECSLY